MAASDNPKIRRLARQVLERAAGRDTSSRAARYEARLHARVVERFASHLDREYDVDLDDPAAAGAALAVLDWFAGTVLNAIEEGAGDPVGIVTRGLEGASEATADKILPHYQPQEEQQ